MNPNKHPVHQCEHIQNLLSKMSPDEAESFTENQLTALSQAIGGRSWATHKVDFRGTVALMRSRYYFVFLAGKNRRELSRLERQIGKFSIALVTTLFFTFSLLLGLLALYLIKSALGINLFEGFSLGIWDWFRDNVF